MKRIFRYLGATLLLTILPFSVMRGENITHNFQEMIPLGTLRFGPGNTSANATTDDVTYTYTCGEDAKFDVVSTVVGISRRCGLGKSFDRRRDVWFRNGGCHNTPRRLPSDDP